MKKFIFLAEDTRPQYILGIADRWFMEAIVTSIGRKQKL
jgi:hypothetical protein